MQRVSREGAGRGIDAVVYELECFVSYHYYLKQNSLHHSDKAPFTAEYFESIADTLRRWWHTMYEQVHDELEGKAMHWGMEVGRADGPVQPASHLVVCRPADCHRALKDLYGPSKAPLLVAHKDRYCPNVDPKIWPYI